MTRTFAILAFTCAASLPAWGAAPRLEVHPSNLNLIGRDASAQILVTRINADGSREDLTAEAVYSPSVANWFRLSAGRAFAISDNKGTIQIKAGGLTASLQAQTRDTARETAVSFNEQVIPILTRFSCNSGGCHGKQSGQNGFRLSLLGFDPELDLTTLTKEVRGRRVIVEAPERSLLLLKASGGIAHGGGKKFDTTSDEYKLIRRWIATGASGPNELDATLERLEIVPPMRQFKPEARQQVVALAHYSDGRVEDVTRMAQYESNDPEVAGVESSGVVRSGKRPGEAVVMVRYSGKIEVFRAQVPMSAQGSPANFLAKGPIDQAIVARWKELGVTPSGLASDAVFIRRLTLDLTGSLPTPERVKAFEASKAPDKDARLADELLSSQEHAYFFAGKWADILRVKRGNQADRAFGTFAFHQWLKDAVANDMPYDQMARRIIASVGDEERSPTTVWYKDMVSADQMVDNLGQVFLGTRLQCAQCHHHPYEKWTQDDYWNMAAFFGQLGRKNIPVASRGGQQQQNLQRQFYYNKGSGNVVNKRNNKPAVPTPLDGDPAEIASGVDPRNTLVDWMTRKDNPFFAKAVANRYWAHFFGRGIVDPLDDMRITNPPSNPALLEALTAIVTSNGYSLRALSKAIVTSGAYRLASEPVPGNAADKQSFARYYPKRMTAEVLHDAVHQVTGSPASFPGLPTDKNAPTRAIMLPDESFSSYFLDVFGRPQRLSPCECERVTEANLAQVLHLVNSEEIQTKLGRAGARADLLAKDPRSDKEKVSELFLWALGHEPDEAKMKLALSHIEKADKNKKQAYENILWALINIREFSWIR